MMTQGVHAPACEDIVEHVHNAYRELGDDHMGLLQFADYVMESWQVEEQIRDGGDPALIAYNARVETELIFAIDHWIVE
jgi:hypothetical protein